jgi:hypothetical protein
MVGISTPPSSPRRDDNKIIVIAGRVKRKTIVSQDLILVEDSAPESGVLPTLLNFRPVLTERAPGLVPDASVPQLKVIEFTNVIY